MLFDLLSGNISKWDLVQLLLSIPVVLISLSFHELSHGFVAEKLGDNTARWNGRITMNPIKHFDPIGMLSMLFFRIGWAKPVPINPRNFKNPKKGMAITGLAGPVSNLILAFVGALLYPITLAIFIAVGATSESVYNLQIIILMLFSAFEYMNIYLAVFNLIPVPPFDGSRIFYFLLPDKYYFSVMKYERIIMLIVIVALFTGALSLPLSFISDKIMMIFDYIIGLVPFL